MKIVNEIGSINTPEELLYNLSLKNRESGYGLTEAEKLFGVSPTSSLARDLDPNIVDNFCHILSNIICRELENKDKLFLYHGTSPKSFILTVVYTLYFHRLLKDPVIRYYLRSDYSNCIEMPTGLDINPEVQKCLMSTNLSPLVNIFTPGESTLKFFLRGVQIADWKLGDLLAKFYDDLYQTLELKDRTKFVIATNKAIESFLELEEILDCTKTGALLQIGIDEKVFDEITKLTTSYGAGLKLEGEMSRYNKTPSEFLLTLKYKPEDVIPYIVSADPGTPGVDSVYNKRYPQYRLFLKEGIIDGNQVIIYPYVIRTNRPSIPCPENSSDKINSYIQSNDKTKWIVDTASRIIDDHLSELDIV
jgi:hypothetical protein